MAETGPDPALLARLYALEPRAELVMRLALRELHASVRGDRSFGDRIKKLLERLDPRPQEMATILAEARATEKNLRPRGEA
jgi:hypothetical protein